MNKNRRRALTLASLLMLTLTLSGCGVINGLLQAVGLASPPPPEVPEEVPLSEQTMSVILNIVAGAEINPDYSNRPSPARARVFISDTTLDLTSLPVEQVFEFGENTLEIKPSASLTVRPGTTNTIVIKSVKSNSKITMAVAFRDPYSAQWIHSLAIDVADNVEVSATISALAVTLDQSF